MRLLPYLSFYVQYLENIWHTTDINKYSLNYLLNQLMNVEKIKGHTFNKSPIRKASWTVLSSHWFLIHLSFLPILTILIQYIHHFTTIWNIYFASLVCFVEYHFFSLWFFSLSTSLQLCYFKCREHIMQKNGGSKVYRNGEVRKGQKREIRIYK